MATTSAPIKKQTIFTELVDSSQAPGKRKRPPLWDWLPTVPTEKWKAGDVDIYLYRYDPTTEKRRFLEKIFEPIDQSWVQKKFGGGDFNAMVHEDSQLIYNDDFMIEGPPKFAGSSDAQPGFTATPNGSGSASLEMMRLAMNPEIMRGMFEMFKMASIESMQMIKNQMPTPVDPLVTLRNAKEILGLGAPASSPLDEITKTFMQAAIQKMLNPPETNAFKDTVTLINDIKSAGFLGAPPKTDVMSTFAANLPMIADRVVTGLREFRLQAEAAERTVRISRGEMRPNDPNVITVDPPPAHQSAADAPPPPPRPAAAPAASTEISPDVAAAIIVQANLQRLVQAMKNPECTGEDICHFLSYVWPEMLVEMAATPKEHLMLLFKTPAIQMQRLGNTILSEMADDPRLPRLIDEFLIAVKKGAPEPAPADANAVAV